MDDELNRGVGEEKTGLASGLRRWAAINAFGEVCPYCGATDITVEGGELVCRRCSSVIRRLFDCEIGYWPSLNEVEEPVRVGAEDVRREREFRARHRDAEDWCIKVEEESRKNTTNIDPDRADGTKLLEKLRGNTTAIQNNDPRNPLSTKAPTKGSMVEENYVRRLAEKLTSSGFFEDGEVAEQFARRFANAIETRVGEQGVEVPTVDRVVEVLGCVLYGVPNIERCRSDSEVVGALKWAIKATKCYEELVKYVIRARFGREPNEDLVRLAMHYLYKLDYWISERIDKNGIDNYIGSPIVASAALAIAKAEKGDLRHAVRMLEEGEAKSIITRLRLREFIEWLGGLGKANNG
jgi:transcription initiation factor TFIIIB Brf1 subunit/transcription initiation factor TFIIB